jgi:hypothetical protein
MGSTKKPQVEALWGAVPAVLTPISEHWAVGRVVASAPEERSTQPRWGIWDLESGKVALGISGAVAIGFSRELDQIGVWRERLESTPGRPFFDGNARSDYRWSFERRHWPAHKRLISVIDLAGEEHAWAWPERVEFSDDASYVVLTCRSAERTQQIFVQCRRRGGDRVVIEPPKPTATKVVKKKVVKKAIKKIVKKVAKKAATIVKKTKTKTKTKTKKRR